MRLLAVLFTASLLAAPVAAQDTPASTVEDKPAQLPVSISKIREALATTPLLSLSTLDERPIFRSQIQAKQKLEELLATLKVKPGAGPAGGNYRAEQNRDQGP